MNDVLKARVLEGAAWLDETYPGWWKSIDLGLLDMADGCACVLGQVFSGLPAQEQDRIVNVLAKRLAFLGGFDSVQTWEVRVRYDNGFANMVRLHNLPAMGMGYGFVALTPLDLAKLLDEWTQLIISYRMQAQPDIDELIEAIRADRELVAA